MAGIGTAAGGVSQLANTAWKIGGSGFSLISGLVNGIVSKRAHDKYAKELGDVSLSMPGAINDAQRIKERLAYGDMPGFDNTLNNIEAGQATTMTQAKQVAASPSALLDALVSSSTAAEQQKRQAEVQNATFQAQGQNNLANFLSTVKAPAEQRIDQFEVDKKIGQMKERLAGTQSLLQGVSNGISGAFGTYGQMSKLGFEQQQSDALSNYWKTLGNNQGGVVNNINTGGSYFPQAGQQGLQAGFGGYGGAGNGFQISG